MRTPDFREAKELFYDLGAFVLAIVPRTIAKITGGTIAAMLAIYCIFGHPLYAWLAWLFVALFLFSAAFAAWREQHKTTDSKQQEVDALNTEIRTIKEEKPPAFEIDEIGCELRGFVRQICQFRIVNCADKTAQNVEVSLMAMDNFQEADNKSLFPPKFPVGLMPENQTGQILINPGGEKDVTLFDARILEGQESHPTVKYARILCDETGTHALPPSLSAQCLIMCSFRETVGQKANVFFEMNKNYCLKIRIGAHDFPPTELECNLNFVGEKPECRFTLTKR